MKPTKATAVLVALLLCACAGTSDRPSDAVRNELTPTGKLRFGVVAAPARTSFFVARGADGQPQGVAADLARELGRRLSAPVEFTIVSSSGELVDTLASGRLDAAFMPPDDERRKRLDFGTLYVADENTYLVPAGSKIRTIADVDYAGARVVAIAGTATSRVIARLLKSATIIQVKSIDDALEMLRTGKADAFALARDSLAPLVSRLPGSRVLEGSFNRVGVAIAVPKHRPNALAYATQFIEDAKGSGLLRRMFDDAGLKNIAVAKPGER
jgi:polar amino acid transport system substrate-binding protein